MQVSSLERLLFLIADIFAVGRLQLNQSVCYKSAGLGVMVPAGRDLTTITGIIVM